MSNRVPAGLRRLVVERAGGVCEYCLIAEEDSYYHHQIEPILSLKHGGETVSENLALACVFCNRNKGSDVGSISADGKFVRFFNPRKDIWSEHFRLAGVVLFPLTNLAEVTIRILRMNDEDHIMEREILAKHGRYPNEVALSLIRIH